MNLESVIAAITPFDAIEAAHQADALDWLDSTNDIYRRVKPATPPKHLVSYVLLADPGDGSVFLVDHRLSGLWLPAGGHVEPFEDPLTTARREAREELGIGLSLACSLVAEVAASDPDTFDPHLPRFLAKLQRETPGI